MGALGLTASLTYSGIGLTSIVFVFLLNYLPTSLSPNLYRRSTLIWMLMNENKPILDEHSSRELPLCNWTWGEEGRWVYDTKSAAAGLRYPVLDDCIVNYSYSCKVTRSKEFPNDIDHLEPRMTEAMNWVWKPKYCRYIRLDGEEFVKRFRGKRFLMLGDSINTEWIQSLKCQLMRTANVKKISKKSIIKKCQSLSKGLKAEEERDKNSQNPKLNDSYFPKTDKGNSLKDARALPCNQPTKYQVSLPAHESVVIMSMNTRFMGALAAWHDLSFSDGRSRLREWWQAIIGSSNPTHIMINTGMHWASFPDADRLMKYLARKTAVDLRAIYNGTIIFRTSMGNIRNCGNLDKPLMTYKEAMKENYIAYNWGDLESYNRIWKEAFKDDDKFVLLSTKPYGLLPFGRRDGHQDCAHSCLPGPYDTWAGDWLWTILKQVPDYW